jgi:hypothetical protein
VSGLPARGKTTLALVAGRALAMPVFSPDPVLTSRWPASPAGFAGCAAGRRRRPRPKLALAADKEGS